MAIVKNKEAAAKEEAWQTQLARFALLSDIVLLIAKTPDLDRLLAQVVNRIKWVIDFERCTLALTNPDEESYRLQTLLETRRSVSKVAKDAVPLTQGIPGDVMQRKQMRLITDLATYLETIPASVDPAMEDGSLATVLSLPLQAYGKMLGAITFSTLKHEGFSDGDIKVGTSLAAHLALAIDRWQQTQKLQQANQELARLASFPELNPSPIIEVDLSCCIHYANPAASQMFPDLEIVGAQHPLLEDLPLLMTTFQAEAHLTITNEIEIGDICYQRVLHFVEQNQSVRIYIFDITERMQAAAAIKQQNEYLGALHETALGLISRLDLNELFEALITRAGQLLGTAHGYIYLVAPSGQAQEAEIERKVGVGVFSDLVGYRLKRGEGLAGKIWQSGQPMVVEDYDRWSKRSSSFPYDTIRAVMGVPLRSGTDVMGVIGLAHSRELEQSFGDKEIDLLSRFAQLASIALDNARLFEAEQHQHQVAESLRQVAAILNASLDQDTVLAKIIEQLQRFINYDSAVILLEEDNDLVISHLIGLPNPETIGYHIAFSSNSPAVRTFKSQQPLVIADVHDDPDWVAFEGSKDIRSWVGIPLQIADRTIGVLTVNSTEVNAYHEADVRLVQAFANQSAIAIENARLFEQTQQANHELSHALADLKATQNQLVEAEKMAALGGLVAGIAHEINTPVGIGVTAASLLEDKTKNFLNTYQSGQMKRSDLEKYLDTAGQSSTMILKNLNRAAELIHSFKQVAVDQSSEERRKFRVKAYLEEILLSLRPTLKKTQHTIKISGGDDITLDSYPGVFSQIVTNLVVNSLVHAYEPEEWGKLSFDFQQEAGHITLEYADDGRGIPKENLNKIFEPFFTTKRGQGGSGLGLHIIYNLVTQRMGGSIRCESKVGRGTRFIIEVPVS